MLLLLENHEDDVAKLFQGLLVAVVSATYVVAIPAPVCREAPACCMCVTILGDVCYLAITLDDTVTEDKKRIQRRVIA
jgi:hypothetical protein